MIKTFFPKASRLEEVKIDRDIPKDRYGFIWFYAKKLNIPVFGWSLFFALATICEILEPLFIGKVLELITDKDNESNWDEILTLLIVYILVVQVSARVFWQIGHKIEGHIEPFISMVVRRDVSSYLYNHCYSFFQNDFAGRLSGKAVEMPRILQEVMSDIVGSIQYILITSLISLIVFSYIDWRFGLMALIFIILNLIFCRWRVPILYAKSEIAAAKLQEMRGGFIDSISNILVVKLFAREKYEKDLFAKSLIRSGEAEQEAERQAVLLWRGQHFINAIFQSCVILFSVYGYKNGTLGIGDVATAITLGIAFGRSLWFLLQTMTGFFGKIAEIQEALDTIITPIEIFNKEGAKKLVISKPSISLNDVSFSYSKLPVLNDFTLEILPYSKIGIIGASGAGKTTFVQLLLRIFDVKKGDIKFDGNDIRDVTLESLRESISFIPQTTDLMHRSIIENIKYGNENASFDEVVLAAKQAHIHDVILNMEDHLGNKGYDALVGERGVKLSGGQRQRVAIARAILKDAPILILDEATSALDSESEALIQASLKDLMQGKTVIAIAHRLSTINQLDRLIVMDEGKIVEDGTHGELLDQNGTYAKLWSMQSGGFLVEQKH